MTCATATGGAISTPDRPTSTVSITMVGGGTVECTYTNHGKVQPSVSTGQDLIPNDSMTLSGATAPADGTVTFNLYSPSHPTCTETPDWTQTVNKVNNTWTTTNGTDATTTFHATDVGTWRWKSTYSGDDNNLPATSACGVENFTIVNVASLP